MTSTAKRREDDDWTRVEQWLAEHGLKDQAGTVAHYALESILRAAREQCSAEQLRELVTKCEDWVCPACAWPMENQSELARLREERGKAEAFLKAEVARLRAREAKPSLKQRNMDECPVTGDKVDNSRDWHCPDCEFDYGGSRLYVAEPRDLASREDSRRVGRETRCDAFDAGDPESGGEPMYCKLAPNHEGNHFMASKCPDCSTFLGASWAVMGSATFCVPCAYRRELCARLIEWRAKVGEAGVEKTRHGTVLGAKMHEDTGAVLAMVDRLRRALGWPMNPSYAAVIDEAISRLSKREAGGRKPEATPPWKWKQPSNLTELRAEYVRVLENNERPLENATLSEAEYQHGYCNGLKRAIVELDECFEQQANVYKSGDRVRIVGGAWTGNIGKLATVEERLGLVVRLIVDGEPGRLSLGVDCVELV